MIIKSQLFDCFMEYITLNTHLLEYPDEWDEKQSAIHDFHVVNNDPFFNFWFLKPETYLIIEFIPDPEDPADSDHIYQVNLTKKQVEDFIFYLNNREEYKSAKKYNL